MTSLLKNIALLLVNEKCYDNYFVEYKIFDVPCFKALLSKSLGLAIIAGSMMVNLPQVLKILKNKSGAGINLFSIIFNLAAITFHMSYSYSNNYPFSAWGDTTFLALQTVAIAALVLYYNNKLTQAIFFTVAYFVIVYVLNCGLTPLNVLFTLQSANIPLMLVGKLSQAWTNYCNGSTGQLSAITAFLLLAGSLARIFTSIQETGDQIMIVTFMVSSFANGLIAAQMLYYWNKPAKILEKKKK